MAMNSSPKQTIDAIVRLNGKIACFWGKHARGWASQPTASLLGQSRLDWQLELSRTLRCWVEPPDPSVRNASLILAWANLGTLVEGTLKWHLSVFQTDYLRDEYRKPKRRGKEIAVDEQSLEPLRCFFIGNGLLDKSRWESWLLKVQQRRNAVHAFKDRELGTHSEFLDDIGVYHDLLVELEGRVPYPDNYSYT